MALRLVSSFKLPFWHIKIRLFPDQGGHAKPLAMPAEITWNEGTNEGKKWLWNLDLVLSVPLSGTFTNILAKIFLMHLTSDLFCKEIFYCASKSYFFSLKIQCFAPTERTAWLWKAVGKRQKSKTNPGFFSLQASQWKPLNSNICNPTK